MEQELFAILGKLLVYLLSIAGAAVLVIRFGAQKWIENRFAKSLEAFKAQKLHEFDILLTRKVKWHEKEHEVLSKSWEMAVEAHKALKRAIAAFRQYPDLDRMSDEDFESFLERSDLSDENKNFISSSADGRNTAYQKVLDHISLGEAHKAFGEFHDYFDKNRIFLRPHIKEKFDKLNDCIWDAWVSRKMSMDSPGSKTDFWSKAVGTEKDEIAPLISDIEDAIQKELFPLETSSQVQEH